MKIDILPDIPSFRLSVFFQYPIYIVHIIPTNKRVKNGGTAYPIILSQVQIISNLPDDFGLAQHVAVMDTIFQTVDICLNFHTNLLVILAPPAELPAGR